MVHVHNTIFLFGSNEGLKVSLIMNFHTLCNVLVLWRLMFYDVLRTGLAIIDLRGQYIAVGFC